MNRRKRMKMPNLLFLCIGGGLGILILIVLLQWDVLLLRISLPHQDEGLVYQSIASPGSKLCMRYIHSVERTPVQGWFTLDPQGGFRAQRTLTTGTGTGLPNVVKEEDVSMQGQWMVVDEKGRYLPQIPFYYLPLNDLQVSVSDCAVDLSGVSPGSKLLIKNEKVSLARALLSMLP